MSRVTATQRTSEEAMLTGLKQRGTRWSLRRRVPADLVEAWGQREVTRALDTSEYKEARKLLPKAWAALDEEFAAFRAALREQPKQDVPDDAAEKAMRTLSTLRAKRDKAAAEGKLAEFKEHLEHQLGMHQSVPSGTPSSITCGSARFPRT